MIAIQIDGVSYPIEGVDEANMFVCCNNCILNMKYCDPKRPLCQRVFNELNKRK